MRVTHLLGLIFTASLAGCATTDSSGAGRSTSGDQGAPSSAATSPEAAPMSGAPSASAPGAEVSPQYGSMMFRAAFMPGGLPLSSAPFQPGDYARWSMGDPTGGEAVTMERARLADDASGNQWWKVRISKNGQLEVIVEALVTADLKQVLKTRMKLNGDAAPRETPGDGQPFMPGMTYTPQMLGATDAGVESITVPAGAVSAHHYVINHGGALVEWWLSDTIPGGIVRESGTSPGQATGVKVIELQAYGKGAVSELGSK